MWGSTCDVPEPLLQAELLLYTVVYCEVDRRWQWIGCISCTGYAVLQATLVHTVKSAFLCFEQLSLMCSGAGWTALICSEEV